uniref:Type I phosphodiesterase/nucleotide pyrophosphatase n=1 Tax=Caulobacter sp. (strain K31) TaxID=366602 RepID=B0SZL7_CAUSK
MLAAMRSFLKTAARSALAAVALFAAPAFAAPLVKPAPKLVVVISIDQFSANLFEQYRADFHGGLGRLAREGVVYPSGYQSHGMTETCPGHSTLLTGKYPNKTGIVANDWYDKQTGKKTYCLDDPSVTLANDPSGGGRLASPKLLMAETYGDWLKAVSPKSRVYAVSGKDRGAINMAGHKADGVFWLETRFGMTTWVEPGQDAKARLAPVAAFNARLVADQKKKPFVWTYANQRCKALEGDYVTGGRAWRAALPPPAPKDEAAAANDLSVSPYTDRVTLEAAQALRDAFKLGDGEATDVLTISLSATDFIGHRYGARGPEMCDQVLRLDDRLGVFLGSLDKVKGQVLVVLTADHGGSDFPERLAEQGYDAGRVPSILWMKALNAQVREQLKLDHDPLVQAGGIESLYAVGADGKTPNAVDRARVVAATLAILAKRPEVYEAYDTNTLFTAAPPPKGTPPDEISVAERMRRSAYPGRVGDVLVAFQPYQTLAAAGTTYVASHGSPWDYDRRVPIVFWWKGGGARERVLPIETVDIAPTIAAVTGVPVPTDVDGRCLPLGTGPGC